MAVNLSPVAGAAAQFFDNSGQVLTGGKLYTYSAGTTTPAITYTTSSGLTAHPNPIILNAAGRVPDSGEIWLTDSVSYKFVLKDANDVLIATYDNLIGINSNFVNFTGEEETQIATQGQTVFTLTTIQYQPNTNNLLVFVNGSKQVITDNYVETSSTVVTFVDGLNVGDVVDFCTATPINTSTVDAANVSYNEGGIGAIDRNVQQKLQENISVKDFGAVGDGVIDDTLAIQDALNAATEAGQKLYFPAGTYVITDTLQPTSIAEYSTVQLIGDGAETVIKWSGVTDLNKAMFGWYTSQVGSWTQASIQDMRFKGEGKVGYVVLFETTNTSSGDARRENENNYFRNVWFEGSKKALVMFGKYSIDTNAQYVSDGNDINCDCTTFDNCTLLNFENYAVKLTGQNIYNTIFRNCFFWSGNNTNVTSANAKNYIFTVSAGMTVVQASTFQRLLNTGNNNGTDKIACLRGAFPDFKVYGSQSEDSRILYVNTEGSPDRPLYLNGIYENSADTPGSYCIFNESSSPITVDSCSFGHLAGSTDLYRNVYSVGVMSWNNSMTAKTTPTVMQLSSGIKSYFNGRRLNEVRPLNTNWHLNSWSVPSATYASATTADYYLNEFYKPYIGSSTGTLQQSFSAGFNGDIARLTCNTLGTTPLQLAMKNSINIADYCNSSMWVIVGGQHDGSFTSSSQLFTSISTDSTGGSGNGTLFIAGNYFVAWQLLDISSSATYLSATLNVNKTGFVDIRNFMIVPDEPGMQAFIFALGQYSASGYKNLPVSFTPDGLGANDTGSTYTYTDTLSPGDSNYYLVSANHSYAGAETSIVLAHALTSNAYVSKVSTLSSGSGASISVSASGLIVSIVVDGTSRAYVKKIKLTDY